MNVRINTDTLELVGQLADHYSLTKAGIIRRALTRAIKRGVVDGGETETATTQPRDVTFSDWITVPPPPRLSWLVRQYCEEELAKLGKAKPFVTDKVEGVDYTVKEAR